MLNNTSSLGAKMTTRSLPFVQHLRVRPPGVEWKTGRNPKMAKNWPKKKMALGPKWGKNGPKIAKKLKNGPKSHFFAIFGPFFPHFGPRAIFYFWPIFSHFRISARFSFYARRPDSQFNTCLLESDPLLTECGNLSCNMWKVPGTFQTGPVQ